VKNLWFYEEEKQFSSDYCHTNPKTQHL